MRLIAAASLAVALLVTAEGNAKQQNRLRSLQFDTPPPTVPSTDTPPPTVPSGDTPPPTVPSVPPAFTIELLYLTEAPETHRLAFEKAAARWSSVIIEDLPATVTLTPGTWCGYFNNPTERVIDDLLIAVNIKPIDGAAGTLAQAGPCAFDESGLPRFGIMEFDTADVEKMIAEGTYDSVVLHEMGHILGIGTLWEKFDLLDHHFWSGDITYTGDNGNQGNEEIGRDEDDDGAYVEDSGGQGTKGGHWKEEPPEGYDTELMTGYAESAGVPMPMSRLTVRSLMDLGYVTNPDLADPFEAPEHDDRRRRLGTEGKVDLRGDFMDLPEELLAGNAKAGREGDFEAKKMRFQSIQVRKARRLKNVPMV